MSNVYCFMSLGSESYVVNVGVFLIAVYLISGTCLSVWLTVTVSTECRVQSTQCFCCWV